MKKQHIIKNIIMSTALAAKKTTIGGQALIEGLLMIGPEKRAMAVRKSSGEIQLVYLAPIKTTRASKWLFIRGSVRLFRQLVSGTKALMRSAELADEVQAPSEHTQTGAQNDAAEKITNEKEGADKARFEETPSQTCSAPEQAAQSPAPAADVSSDTVAHNAASDKPDTASAAESQSTRASGENKPDPGEKDQRHQKKKSLPAKISAAIDHWLENHIDAAMYITAVLGILFSVALFILLPNLLASFVRQLTVLNTMSGRGATILLNLIEGLIRISIFVLYLALTSKLKDIRRVWMYHGAEHKTIACYEDGKTLSIDQVRGYSRFHPRCGTAFLFIVILVSIVVFSFVGWWNRWLNLLIRFALVPLVAGIAYEIIRLAGRYDNKLTRFMSAPGLWLQRFTTAEPDDSMLEVAITAMNAVKPASEDTDKW